MINLPNNTASYRNGNGEGIWVIALTPEDERRYNEETSGTIKVITYNHNVTFPQLPFNSVIDVELRGRNNRPVLTYELMNFLRGKSTHGKNSTRRLRRRRKPRNRE